MRFSISFSGRGAEACVGNSATGRTVAQYHVKAAHSATNTRKIIAQIA
jgi:hypothetical protein